MKHAPCILVVEDDERIRSYITTILTSSGYSILETANARTALSIITSHNPDLLLLDCLLYTSPSPRDA